MKIIFYLLATLGLNILAGAQTTVTFGNGTAVASGTSNYQGPIYRSSATSSLNFARHRILYRESDLASIGIYPGVDITQIGWDKVNTGGIAPGRSATFKLYMKQSFSSTLDTEAWGEALTGATTVLSDANFTNVPTTTGYWMIDFDTPFVYTGGNIELFTDWAINPGSGIATTNDFQLRCTIVSGYKTSAGTASSAPLDVTSILSTSAAGAGIRYPNTRFTISPSANPLPVSISAFLGERIGLVNKLSWTTKTEQNNKGFELQRSADGVNFSSLAIIASKAVNGNSSAQINYEFKDLKPFSGNGYYRLKQIDNDGKFSLSQVVLIKGDKIVKMEITNVYPNPTVEKLNMRISSPVNESTEIAIFDLTGKQMLKHQKQLNPGENNLSINVSNLAPGSYFLKASTNNSTEMVKFLKF